MAEKKRKSAYEESGVNIGAADKAIELMRSHIQSTYNPNVLSDIGTFGGLLDISIMKMYEHPVLVLSIDGAGTKTMIAKEMNLWTVGQCIVNHCANDILVQGARPLAFLNYVAASRLKPKTIAKIVENMAIACKAIGIPIIGGETAEMPGVYQERQHDIVGAVIGIVEKKKIIYGSKIKEGDILIGLPSNGIHTNGLSLARKAFFQTSALNAKSFIRPEEEDSYLIGEELLRVHKCYFNQLFPILNLVHGIAHITGGGLIDNIARLLAEKLQAKISQEWDIPPVFRDIQSIENVSDAEMRKVFNLGIGMVLIVPSDQSAYIKGHLLSFNINPIFLGRIKKRKTREKVVFTY